jgi:inner membrane protein
MGRSLVLIGHAPAGYLVTRAMCRWLDGERSKGARDSAWMWLGLAASVLPDVDLVYAWLIARDGLHHHLYWTHIPFFWLLAIAAGISIGALCRRSWTIHVALVAGANVITHLVLDSVASGIAWLYPCSDELIALFPIFGSGGWWLVDFVLDWTFSLELVLVAAATIALRRDLRAHRSRARHVHHSKPSTAVSPLE